jgi:hypothetical protein
VFETSWFITNSSPFSSMFHLMPESSQSKDLDGLLQFCYDKGFVMILLYSLVSVFDCKRILCSDSFFSSLLQTGCL